jgi:hypothetical protein
MVAMDAALIIMAVDCRYGTCRLTMSLWASSLRERHVGRAERLLDVGVRPAGVEVDHAAIEAPQAPRQHAADVAEADEADGLAGDLEARLAHLGLRPLAGAHRVRVVRNAPVDARGSARWRARPPGRHWNPR